jgi:hypothetical protein
MMLVRLLHCSKSLVTVRALLSVQPNPQDFAADHSTEQSLQLTTDSLPIRGSWIQQKHQSNHRAPLNHRHHPRLPALATVDVALWWSHPLGEQVSLLPLAQLPRDLALALVRQSVQKPVCEPQIPSVSLEWELQASEQLSQPVLLGTLRLFSVQEQERLALAPLHWWQVRQQVPVQEDAAVE